MPDDTDTDARPRSTTGLGAVLPFLVCPHCAGPLRGDTGAGGTLRCPAGHAFDVARQGYVSLLARGTNACGDDSAMVAARREFLARGYYTLIARLITDVAAAVVSGPGCVVDIGAGTGYYLAHLLDRLTERHGIAIDASKYAARGAARAHPRAGAVVADAWRRLPVADGAAALVLDVFAPRVGAEFHRVLRPAGTLLVVTPTPRHLVELVEPLGLLRVDARKAGRLATELDPWFVPERTTTEETTLTLGHDDIATLVGMTPSARHLGDDQLRRRLAALPDPMPVTVSVTASAYRARR